MNDEKRILLVEDEENNQKLISDYLTSFGYVVVIADAGSDAMQLAERQSFDAVILDLRLPEKNGFVVLRLLREMDRFSATPIIVTSAFDSDANKMKAYKTGANFFLSKPINIRELRMIIENNT